ncbi:hypothetical protein CA85_11660 [Allorhodopirellula solitaria]|uniref:Uncharacterized protein n=1 Tax=Allorhodopirellula solitaria TaxID=2527987 RepID=A0A5C5YGU3_9BACT|nr:hypothetical protein CA85_11660 [Allorhodopirellula solitaria]
MEGGSLRTRTKRKKTCASNKRLNPNYLTARGRLIREGRAPLLSVWTLVIAAESSWGKDDIQTGRGKQTQSAMRTSLRPLTPLRLYMPLKHGFFVVRSNPLNQLCCRSRNAGVVSGVVDEPMSCQLPTSIPLEISENCRRWCSLALKPPAIFLNAFGVGSRVGNQQEATSPKPQDSSPRPLLKPTLIHRVLLTREEPPRARGHSPRKR